MSYIGPLSESPGADFPPCDQGETTGGVNPDWSTFDTPSDSGVDGFDALMPGLATAERWMGPLALGYEMGRLGAAFVADGERIGTQTCTAGARLFGGWLGSSCGAALGQGGGEILGAGIGACCGGPLGAVAGGAIGSVVGHLGGALTGGYFGARAGGALVAG